MGSFWSATHAAPPDGAIVPRAEPGQSEAGSSSETSSSSGYSSMPSLESSGCSLPALERESSGPYESWNHPMIYGIIGTESGRPIQIVGGSTRVEAMRNTVQEEFAETVGNRRFLSGLPLTAQEGETANGMGRC